VEANNKVAEARKQFPDLSIDETTSEMWLTKGREGPNIGPTTAFHIVGLQASSTYLHPSLSRPISELPSSPSIQLREKLRRRGGTELA